MKLEVCDVAPTNWPVRTLESVCHRVTSGGTPSRRNPAFYEKGAWPWVKTQELMDTWVDTTEEHITNEAVAKSSAKVLPANTVLLAMYGATVGQLGILRRPMTCNQACCALIVDPKQANYRYIFYQLLNARAQLKSLATGAAQQNLSGTLIKSIRLPVPSIKEQDAIVQLLGALDDKIELNRRMSETLEQIAQSLFDRWIEDVSAENTSLKVEPSWVTFAEVAHEHKVKWLPNQDEVVDHHSLPAFDSGIQPVREHSSSIKSAKTLVPNGAVLVSRLNPRIPRIWLTDTSDDVLAVASTEFLVATPKEPFGRSFLYLFASSSAFQQSLISMATGTSGSHQRVRPASVMSLQVPTAPASELTKLEGQLHPLLDRIAVARRESRTLAHLRDTLLPKLISGEIRVPQAEQLVSEVV